MSLKTSLATALALLASTSLVSAQTQTGVVNSLGIGQAQSQSASQASATSSSQGGGGGSAVATGGRGGRATATGGNVRASQNINFNSPGTVNNNNTNRQRSSGSLRTTVPAVAPNLVASAVGTCLGSASIGIGATGWGFGAGSTIPDKNCDIRMFSEALMKVGQNAAATAVLCRNPEAYLAMTSVGLRCPIVPDGYTVAGYGTGMHPYQVETHVVTAKANYRARPTYEQVPVIVPAVSTRVPVVAAPTNARYAAEQAEAKAAVARIDAEYKIAKQACQARGDRVC